MAQKSIGTNWTRESRNAMESNFDELYAEYIGAGNSAAEAERLAKEAVITANKAKEESDLAVTEAQATQTQLDDIILDDGTGNAEVIQAREGEPLLKDRLNKSDQQLMGKASQADLDITNQQLAETAKQTDLDIRSYDYRPEAIASFQFDDGTTFDYERFMPIFKSEGVPGSCCIITKYIGTEHPNGLRGMSVAQLKELKALGWTVASHTHTHANLAQVPLAEAEEELRVSSEILKDLGMHHDIIVWPYGAENNAVIEVARRYYQYGIHIDTNLPNFPPHIDNFRVSRVPGLSQTGATLASCKAHVDAAVATGNWVIFEDHSNYGFYGNQTNLNLLRELIQYVKSKQIEIVAVHEGVKMKANILQLGNVGSDDFVKISRNGKIDSTSNNYSMIPKPINFANISVKEFPQGVTEFGLNSSQATSLGLPEAKGGTLITHRQPSDVGDNYSYQFYNVFDSTHTYKRRWDYHTNKWGDFQRFDSLHKKTVDNAFGGRDLLTAFPKNQVTVTYVSSSEQAQGLPNNTSAIIETFRLNESTNHNFQISTDVRGVRSFRNWNTTAWSNWIEVGSRLPRYTPTSMPTPSEDNRGQMIFQAINGGTGDRVWICLRKGDGAYAWREVSVT